MFNNVNGTEHEKKIAGDYLNQTQLNVIPGFIDNKTCYRQALNTGKVLTEASYVGPRVKAKYFIKSIIDILHIKEGDL